MREAHLNDEAIRQNLMQLPVAAVPGDVAARVRVIASHERERRVRRHRWLEKLSIEFSNLLKPLAVPAAGGLMSSLILFGTLVDNLNLQLYLNKDVPIGVHTQVAVDDLSPFLGTMGDFVVEVSVNEKGIATDFSVPNGRPDKKKLLEIGNLVLYSTFTPATEDGQPVPGKILVAVHHINVRG
jgi:hypothetical protein